MNKQIRELAEQAGYKPLPGFDFANSMEEVFIKKFAELIVKHIVEKIEYEAELAWAQDQGWTNSTLLALSLEILEDFDMEMDLDVDQEEEE